MLSIVTHNTTSSVLMDKLTNKNYNIYVDYIIIILYNIVIYKIWKQVYEKKINIRKKWIIITYKLIWRWSKRK